MAYKLSYFDGTGRAEFIRLVFAAAGQDFEDERLDKEKWMKFKPETPMKAMPVLTVEGKGMGCQSGSIARYLAKEFGLFGSGNWEEFLIDEAVECVQEMIAGAIKWLFEADEEKKTAARDEFAKTSVVKFIDYIRLRMKGAKNGFIVGDKLSLADIAVFTFIDAMRGKGNMWFDECDDIKKHYDMVGANEGIAKWISKREAKK